MNQTTTCVVAVKGEDKRKTRIVLGGDAAGVGGYRLQTRKQPKVFVVGSGDMTMLMGYTTSFRMGQLLEAAFSPPKLTEGQDHYEYMVTDFVDAVRALFKSKGYAQTDDGQERGGTFIVAFRGEIYVVESDYQVACMNHDYAAVGCGRDIALGSLYSTGVLAEEPRERAELALRAAEEFSAGVRGPFTFIEHTWDTPSSTTNG